MAISGPMAWFGKTAILAMYIRLFGAIHWMRTASYVLIVLVGLLNASNIVMAVIYCHPRKGEGWDQTPYARCFSTRDMALATGVLGAVGDLAIFALPFPV